MTTKSVDEPIPLRAWGVLAILICFYLLSFIDKQMYSLLINPIGDDLGLTDFQLGTIQGVAFSGFYTFGVLLTGWAVDRYSRRMILLIGVIFWSCAAAASGLADSFAELFAARAAVGLGEAVLIPAALAMLAVTFPRKNLSFATGIFYSGANIGGVIALILGGGIIATLVGMGETEWPVFGRLEAWQAAFVITGLPGVLVAFLAFGLPGGSGAPAGHRASTAADSGVQLWPFIRRHKMFLAGVMFSTGFLTMLAYTLIVWTPAHFDRRFGWEHDTIGFVMAAGIAAGGVGNVLWGWIADRMRKRGHTDALFRLYIVLTLAGFPFGVVTFMTHDPTIAIIGYPLTWLLMNSFGPMLSAMQLGIPDHLRGRLLGLKTVFTGLVGLGAAPLFVAAITDFVFRDKAMLGYSMIVSLAVSGSLAVLALVVTRRAYVVAVREQDAMHGSVRDAVRGPNPGGAARPAVAG